MLRKLAALIMLMTPTLAGANTSSYQLNFGPYVGGGDISNGARVRHTSGYTLAVERNWKFNDSLAIGPRVEVIAPHAREELLSAEPKLFAHAEKPDRAALWRYVIMLGHNSFLALSAIGK